MTSANIPTTLTQAVLSVFSNKYLILSLNVVVSNLLTHNFMSKYNDYGEFMVAVLNEADYKCHRNAYGSLVKLFGLSGANEKLIPIMITIFEIGWPAFKATCALLILGPIAFIGALAAFIVGGIGAIIVAALAIYGG